MTHDHPRRANHLAQQTHTGPSIALVQQCSRLNSQSFGTAVSTPGEPSIWHHSGHTGVTTHSVQRCPPRGIQSLDTVTITQGQPCRDNGNTGTTNAVGTSPSTLGRSSHRQNNFNTGRANHLAQQRPDCDSQPCAATSDRDKQPLCTIACTPGQQTICRHNVQTRPTKHLDTTAYTLSKPIWDSAACTKTGTDTRKRETYLQPALRCNSPESPQSPTAAPLQLVFKKKSSSQRCAATHLRVRSREQQLTWVPTESQTSSW